VKSVGAKQTEVDFRSADGRLRLHVEIRGPEDALLTVLCLHGLTRNRADFGFLAQHLSTRYRVITADQRGRGKSQWDPDPANYHPGTYVADMFALLDGLAIDRVVLIGTSMGGLMAMIMGASQPARLRGIVLNDIGPEVPVSGLKRLRRSLNDRARAATWAEAAQQAKRINEIAFPDYVDADWEAFARRTYVEDASARPVAAFDPAILKGLNETDLTAVPPNLWSLWKQLGSIPILAIRGALSDIISPQILDAMAAHHPNLTVITIANRGHAPMLDEPDAVAAIDAFLKGLATT
jgi:pimeloyl-ACP methyl ester carboxylesterase